MIMSSMMWFGPESRGWASLLGWPSEGYRYRHMMVIIVGELRRHVDTTARCIHSCYKDGRERQIRLPLFPIVGTVRCRRSLRGPRRRPNGTGLSSAITIAPLVAVPSTRAPEHLAPEHCAVCAKSAIHSCAHCSCTGHTQEKRSLRCTRGCVWSALKCQLRMAIATA